jgi:DNA repair exonuclease SbcCD nuclease subunit
MASSLLREQMGIKTLVVGDPHLQVQKINDARKFIERLYPIAVEHEMLILLGDLFHTFAVVRSEVLSLWNEFFDHIYKRLNVVALVGNHDYAGQSGGSHALEVFKGKINVVDRLGSFAGIYYLPFIRDNALFELQCRGLPRESVLICHQSFAGAAFDNGYYDPQGAKTDCVSHLGAVISGHIHTQQKIGNIWYPGTPFQHTFAEAGQEKRVFTIHLSQTGYTLIKEHDLGMPRFEIIQVKDLNKPLVEALLDVLPIPESTVSYRISGRGSPQEIADFWKTPQAKAFRTGARRVVDALIPDRGAVNLPGSNGKTKREKLESFIRGKKWRTSEDELCDKAAALAFRG